VIAENIGKKYNCTIRFNCCCRKCGLVFQMETCLVRWHPKELEYILENMDRAMEEERSCPGCQGKRNKYRKLEMVTPFGFLKPTNTKKDSNAKV